MSSRSDNVTTRRIPLGLVPLAVYLGVTLLVPALNGASRGAGFWEHVAITAGVSGLLSWPWLVAGRASARPEPAGARGIKHAADGVPVPDRNR